MPCRGRLKNAAPAMAAAGVDPLRKSSASIMKKDAHHGLSTPDTSAVAGDWAGAQSSRRPVWQALTRRKSWSRQLRLDFLNDERPSRQHKNRPLCQLAGAGGDRAGSRRSSDCPAWLLPRSLLENLLSFGAAVLLQKQRQEGGGRLVADSGTQLPGRVRPGHSTGDVAMAAMAC